MSSAKDPQTAGAISSAVFLGVIVALMAVLLVGGIIIASKVIQVGNSAQTALDAVSKFVTDMDEAKS